LMCTTERIEKLQTKYKRSTKRTKENCQLVQLAPVDIIHAEDTLIKHVHEEIHSDVGKASTRICYQQLRMELLW